MNTNDVDEAIAKIKRLSDDDETAHSCEDSLHKADDYQKNKRNEIVVDRRAGHALMAILENYRLAQLSHPKERTEE